MDNNLIFAIEKLGATIYLFGECVWATALKIKVQYYKLAIIGVTREQVIPLLDNYTLHRTKPTLQISDGDTTYELYFLNSIDSVPFDPISINNAILSLDCKVFRADDLKNKLIRANTSTFLDYPEELLRICRIAAQTSFAVDVPTWVTMYEHSRLIKNVVKSNPAYIGKQLQQIIMSKNPGHGFRLMLETNVLQYIFPELARCNNIRQTRRGEGINVFEHILLAINAAALEEEIRWTMLFHDMAKPTTMDITSDGKMHFFKHEFVGAELAVTYMTKYKLPPSLIQTVKILIENHMFDADPKLTVKGVRRLIKRVGKENIYQLIKVREADRRGTMVPPSNDKIELLKTKIEKELSNV